MPNNLLRPTTGVLLSGGIDSAVLLHQLLERGARVVPLYVRTGCAWDDCELAAARRFLCAVQRDELARLIVLDMPLADLYGDHWSISGINVPGHETPDEAVFMPGRNPLLLIKPALWCQMHGIRRLALATLANNPFDDATPAFFTTFEAMLEQAAGDRVQIVRPFEHLLKRAVMDLGRDLPLELTFSCLAPVGGLHCGRCNKCAERQQAFRHAHLADKTHYAVSLPQRPSPIHSAK